MDSNFQLVEIWFFPTSQLMNPISPRKRFCFSSSVSLVASCCQATLQYSVFENYISALHPGKSASTCAMVKLRGLFSHCGFGMVSIFFHRDSYTHDVWIPDMGWMTIDPCRSWLLLEGILQQMTEHRFMHHEIPSNCKLFPMETMGFFKSMWIYWRIIRHLTTNR